MGRILWREIDRACHAQGSASASKEQVRWREVARTPDLYERLEVSPYASSEVIKRAYRTLMEKYHPDRQPECRKLWAEDIAKQLNQAYWVLKDTERRAAYDQRSTI